MGRSKSYSNQENQRGRNKMTRQEKVQQGTQKIIKDKFINERQPEPIVAKTDKQKEYLKMLNDPNIQVICCLGLHGVGKTFLPSCVAADKYRKGEIKKIIEWRQNRFQRIVEKDKSQEKFLKGWLNRIIRINTFFNYS